MKYKVGEFTAKDDMPKKAMNHDAFMALSTKDKIAAADLYLALLRSMAGKQPEERKAFLSQNHKKIMFKGHMPPSSHDDTMALFSFYGYEEALRDKKVNKHTLLKRLDELAKACIDAYNVNSKIAAIPAVHYNDLLDIAKRAIEVAEEYE